MSLPPGGLTETRSLCKKLRQQFRELKIYVGWWGRDVAPARARLAKDADEVVSTLLELRNHLKKLLPAPQPHEPDQPAAHAATTRR